MPSRGTVFGGPEGSDTTGCKMMRWLAGIAGLVLMVGLSTGCNRQCFLSKEVFDEAHNSLLPQDLEEPGALQHAPLTGDIPAPPTLSAPDRPPRYLSLQESIAIALENGTASSRGGLAGGVSGTGA